MSLAQLNGKAPTHPSSPALRINKDSHFIKKPTFPPAAKPPPHRQPVIIYTHSPKIIHTHPRDFMALVQKLTGQSSSTDSTTGGGGGPPPSKQDPPPPPTAEPNKNRRRVVAAAAAASDDTDSSSVVTDESCGSTAVRNVEIKSCFPPPPPPTTMMTTAFYDHPSINNPCFNNIMNIPFFPSPNSGGDFYSSSATHHHQPFFSNYYNDSLILMNNNMRSSISSSSLSSSSFQGMKEFREF